MKNEFGFTNDEADIIAVRAFRDAAAADGWVIKPTYKDVIQESTLDRDGYKMMILTRDKETPNGRWKYCAQISLWGPDGLAIEPPATYDFDAIKAAGRVCSYCKATDVDTARVGFAGRACLKCAPVEEAKLPRNFYD